MFNKNIYLKRAMFVFIMKNKLTLITIFCFLVLISFLIPSNNSISEDKKTEIVCNYDFSSGYADLIDKILPSVVNISSISVKERQISPIEEFFGMHGFTDGMMQVRPNKKIKQKLTSLGSGFFIDKEGHVVTNYHVIKDAMEIKIKTSGENEYTAKVVGYDEKSDLAVLKTDIKKVDSFVVFGSSEKTRIGDKVLTIGNPFGLGGSVTSGIISAKSRTLGGTLYDDLMQTDAAINKGNSGGPMFNLCGEVIGINSAIFSTAGGGNIGIGFAIASDSAIHVIEKLKNKEKISHAWLGVEIQQITDEMRDALNLTKTQGGYVNNVVKDSPAEKGGIKSGDVIVAIDGKKITNTASIASYIATRNPNSDVKIVIVRHGKEITLTVKLQEANDNKINIDKKNIFKSKDTFDIEIENLTKEKRFELRIPDNINGVLVIDVKNEMLLEFGEIQSGDVISAINGHDVLNVSDFSIIAKKIKSSGKKHVVFKIYRQGMHISLGVPIR